MDATIQALQQNMEHIQNYFGSSLHDQVMKAFAWKFTLANKSFSGVAFQAFLDKAHAALPKKQWYEAYVATAATTAMEYKLIAHLYLQTQPEDVLQTLLHNEQRLQQAGFQQSIYRTMAALSLQQDTRHEVMAYSLYEEMRKRQRLLTGKDAIPYAVLVTANLHKDVVTRADTMYRYYHELAASDFKRGDALQTLSQLLTLYDVHYRALLVTYVQQLKYEIEKRGAKVKKRHYAQLGILAMTLSNTEIIETVMAMYSKLILLPSFKSDVHTALTIAIQYGVKEQLVTSPTNFAKLEEIINILSVSELAVYASGLLLEGITTFLPFN